MKRLVGARMGALLLCLVALSFLTTGAFSVSAHGVNGSSASSSKITIWLQTMDSCRQAIPGPKYVLQGNGLNLTAGPAPGSGPKTVGSGNCPLQRGTWTTGPSGCVSWTILVPSTTTTCIIKETFTPSTYIVFTEGSL